MCKIQKRLLCCQKFFYTLLLCICTKFVLFAFVLLIDVVVLHCTLIFKTIIMKKVASFLFAVVILAGATSCSYKTCPTYTKAPVEKQDIQKDIKG